MNIVFLRSNPVNPDSRVEKEVNSLVKEGHNVIILAWDRNNSYKKVKKEQLCLPDGTVDIYRFGIEASFGGGIKNNLVSLLKFQITLLKWLLVNNKKYEIIHACDFDTAYIGHKVTKILNKKLVYDIFDYYVDAFSVPTLLKKIITKMDHKIINEADAVIICSEKRVEQIRGTMPKKLEIIHNTPSQSQFYPSMKSSQKSRNIKLVYVGVLAKHRLIKEVLEFVQLNKNIELHIGGFGEYEKLVKSASNNYDNIHYYGKLTYQKTLELESSCDIMTAIYDPSVANHRFAAPNKFYEALMLGKPLIVAKNTGIDEIIKENEFGEVIEYDINSFEEAVKNILDRKESWSVKSSEMRAMYKKHYDWIIMDKRIVRLYDSIK